MSDNENITTSDQTAALYLVIAVVVSLLGAIFCEDKRGDFGFTLGFWSRTFMFFFLVPGAYLGLKAGRWARDVLCPDFIISRNVSGLVKNRIFWAIGPQTIGLVIGMLVTGTPFIFLARWLLG